MFASVLANKDEFVGLLTAPTFKTHYTRLITETSINSSGESSSFENRFKELVPDLSRLSIQLQPVTTTKKEVNIVSEIAEKHQAASFADRSLVIESLT